MEESGGAMSGLNRGGKVCAGKEGGERGGASL